jgi:peptidoglycan hydrolase CwlO-like protein
MSKVKEELLLSMIFIGKWLVLGLGVVGVLYLAINLAYHKSYFDPRMEKFDYDIAKLEEKKNNINLELNALEKEKSKKERRLKLKKSDLKSTNEDLDKIKDRMSNLGLDWWKLRIFNNDNKTDKVYFKLDKARNKYDGISKEIDDLSNAIDSYQSKIQDKSDKINEYIQDILEVKEEKEETEVDVKGPMGWLIGMLGLT